MLLRARTMLAARRRRRRIARDPLYALLHEPLLDGPRRKLSDPPLKPRKRKWKPGRKKPRMPKWHRSQTPPHDWVPRVVGTFLCPRCKKEKEHRQFRGGPEHLVVYCTRCGMGRHSDGTYYERWGSEYDSRFAQLATKEAP